MSGRAATGTEPLRTSLWRSCTRHTKELGGEKYWWLGTVPCPKCNATSLRRKETHEED